MRIYVKKTVCILIIRTFCLQFTVLSAKTLAVLVDWEIVRSLINDR